MKNYLIFKMISIIYDEIRLKSGNLD